MASKLSLKTFVNGIIIFSKGIRSTGSRTLYTAEAIGVDAYEKQRVRTQTQFTGMVDKFREKMSEFTYSDTKNMIFTEDLKHMVHLIGDTPEDLKLIHAMMKRFNSQNRHLRFGNFIFGPVVMRMYHHLNQPKLALEAFTDPELDGFFEQLASYQVLCDLLYRNGNYDDIIKVFDIVKSKQVQGQRFPRNITILVFAACYKLNTIQSYEYALELLNQMKEFGTEPVRRSTAFAAALALNQNAPQVALEILTNSRTSNYVTIRNLKAWALAELNRPDDCLPILRYSIEFDGAEPNRQQTVFQEVLDKVKLATDRMDNKEVSVEFERIVKALAASNQLSKSTISDCLDTEIAVGPNAGQGGSYPSGPGSRMGGGGYGQDRRNVERSFRGGRNEFRPQRSPAYDRDIRQSIKSE